MGNEPASIFDNVPVADRSFTRQQLIDEIEKEIVTRKRLMRSRLRNQGDDFAHSFVAIMKAIATELRNPTLAWEPYKFDLEKADQLKYPALVSWYGFDGSGSGLRHSHVGIASRPTDFLRFHNAYAIAPVPRPAHMPPRE